MNKQAQKAFLMDDWLVSPLEGTLTRGDDVERLEPKAMEVLAYLASRPGEVVTREELERDVWHGALVGYDAVTSTIIKLRKALQDDARRPRFITTIPKRGYQLVAPVSFRDQDDSPASLLSIGQERPTEPQQKEHPARLRNRTLLTAIALALLMAGGLIWFWPAGLFAPDSTGSRQIGELRAPPSIVVVPFENLGGDPKQDFLADGITEDIITDLSKLSNVMVIASTTASQLKGKQIEPSEIGAQLKVKYLLKGSIRRLDDSIRVNAQLVDIKTGFNIWAQRYDRKLAEVFSLQHEVTSRIVESLAVKVSKKERQRLERQATDNLKAYDFFQEGQRFFSFRTRDGYEEAEKMYRLAIAFDPGYGRAYGALAVTLGSLFRDGYTDDPMETLDRALDLAKKAVALDDSTPQTYWALSFVHMIRKEFDKAVQAATEAVSIAPNYADGWGMLAVINGWLGYGKESIEFTDKGVRLNPFYTHEYLLNYGLAYYALGEYDSAIVPLEAAHERNANHIAANVLLTACYVRTNRQEDAEWLATQIQFRAPATTITDLEKTLPIGNPELGRRLFEDLRKAGLPE